MTRPKIIAVLDSMWDWRQQTSQAGYGQAPRAFKINPQNHSGKRLYRLVGKDANLLVTNACKELVSAAHIHGTPDPEWLRSNLEHLMPFNLLLVCGKVAQATYAKSGFQFECKLDIMHPAARTWSQAKIMAVAEEVKILLAGCN